MSRLSSFRRTVRRRLRLWEFRRRGMKPWTRGYLEYKQDEIERTLRAGGLPPGALPAGYGYRIDERIIEYPWLFSRLPDAPGALLDAGSVLNFDFLLEHASLRTKKIHICTLAPEHECFWQRGVSYLYDDLRRLPYKDGWFDWVVCLSTLEHVGMDNTLLYTRDAARNEYQPKTHLQALAELRRVLKPGGTLFLSVPFGRARNHGWLQIFDQAMVEEMIGVFAPSSSRMEHFQYLPAGWQRSTAVDAASATFFDIHHASGHDPDFAASARAVCCLELTP